MQNPIYNQLYGFIQTPALWKAKELFEMQQFKIPHIKLLNSDEFFNNIPNLSTQYVLGKRMEIFFKEILNQSEDHKINISNIQIFKDKITLGEIDFILEDFILEQQIHLELVYKFYVYDPSIFSEIDRWIGPNRKDTLQQKIKKLKSQQFALLQRPETVETLSQYDIDTAELVQKVCFKANLFVPRSLLNKEFDLINNECIVGYYINLDEFMNGEFMNDEFYIPKKQDWPVLPEYNINWNSFENIQNELTSLLDKERAPLVWRKIDNQTFERFFVVWW